MLADGLIDEVKRLKKMGYHKGMVSMQGLGYKEILSYLDGTWSLEEAIYVLKRDTRHFAKRQITWFKRERQVEWFDKQDFAKSSNIPPMRSSYVSLIHHRIHQGRIYFCMPQQSLYLFDRHAFVDGFSCKCSSEFMRMHAVEP